MIMKLGFQGISASTFLFLLEWKTVDSFQLSNDKIYNYAQSRNHHHLLMTPPSKTIFKSSKTSICAYSDDNNNDIIEEPSSMKKKICIIGGGWGGWGAAKALCEATAGTNKSGDNNYEIILMDALPDPTGRTPYLSSSGKPVEAGTRGFWMDYPNINKLCEELNLKEDDVFTPFTNSSFYSPDGLEATAPVFSQTKFPSLEDFNLPFDIPSSSSLPSLPFLDQLQNQPVPQLPSPLGQIIATFPLFERIPLADRASMAGLLLATIDCLGGDEKTQAAYDRMNAHDLFVKFRLSERLVSDFIKPTLLVGLFKPPEELSALVVMELLYYYALAHQDSFDVRWIKNGTVSDSLIAPLAEYLEDSEDWEFEVKGGCRVQEVSLNQNGDDGKLNAHKITYYDTQSGCTEILEDVGGVILALGCKGTENVVKSSSDLARLPVFSKAASLKGIDVISVRLWLDEIIPTRTPANVFSRFEALRGAGGTFFMLDQLQENNVDLWGGDETDKKGSVVACDFYNAGALLSLSDDDIVKILMEELLPSAVSKFADANVVDSWVGRYPGTVSWFSPGSYGSRPPLEGAGNKILPNLKCAGDWVRMGEREHGAKGLCQERAYVSGIEAANSLMDSIGMNELPKHNVIPVRDDEPQFKLGVEINNKIMNVLPRFWVR